MSTKTAPRSSTAAIDKPAVQVRTATGVLILTALLGLLAILGPNLVADDLGMAMSMGMTHYMELLAGHQPRNLLIFMALPVVLAVMQVGVVHREERYLERLFGEDYRAYRARVRRWF